MDIEANRRFRERENPRHAGGAPSLADAIQTDLRLSVLGYHDRTKHAFKRFANSLGYLDWANQPNPFRRFEGAPRIHL